MGACQNSVGTPDHGSDKGTDSTDSHPSSSKLPSIENLETSAGLDGKIFNFSLKEALAKVSWWVISSPRPISEAAK